jgi:dienelactone hydrolase
MDASIGPLFTPPQEFQSELETFPSALTFADGRQVETAGDWRERRKEILSDWHQLLGPWPPLLERPDLTCLESEPVEGFTRHRVQIQIAPDRSTLAYLLVPDGAGPFPAVLDVFYFPEDGAGLTPDKRLQNDFGYQLAKRGFVALCIGQQPGKQESPIYYPSWEKTQLQPLSYLAYVAANGCNMLANLPAVDPDRIGVVGHSYGGKWAMFAGSLYERFACTAVSDPGIVFDESRPNVNYWEPWYLGHAPGREPRTAGIPSEMNPRTGAYKRLRETGRDLNLLHVLMAPRPFFVAGGSEDLPERWRALHDLIAVNKILGYEQRAGMANRPEHRISPEANAQICLFFETFLKTHPKTHP